MNQSNNSKNNLRKRMLLCMILASISGAVGCQGNMQTGEPMETTEFLKPTVTATLTATPEPTATVTPTEAPEPTVTVAPTEEPEPTATAVPTEEPEPTVTAAPTEEPEPTAMTEPTVIPKLITEYVEKDGITYYVSKGKASVIGYDGMRKNVIISESIDGYPVVEIERRAFANCEDLQKVTIPEGVTKIGEYAFYFCRGLQEINIPESVTEIGNTAFYLCCGLTELRIPDGVTKIEDNVFTGCYNLEELRIPEGVTSIGDCAFWECAKLTEFKIPEGITRIGNEVFTNCSGLTELTIPEGVTSIGNEAFLGCSGLKKIVLPESLEAIGDRAFCGSGLTEITIPENVSHIGEEAFSNCYNLESAEFPQGENFDEKEILENSKLWRMKQFWEVIENDTSRWGMWDLTYMEFIEMYRSIGTENDLFLQMLKEKGPRHTDPTIFYEYDGLSNLNISFPDVLTEKIYALHYAPFEYGSEDYATGQYGKSELEAFEDHGGVCGILANTYEIFVRDILGETNWKYCQYSNASANHAVLLIQTEDGKVFQIDNCGVDYWWLGVEFRPVQTAAYYSQPDFEAMQSFENWKNEYKSLNGTYWHTYVFLHNFDLQTNKWQQRIIWYNFETKEFESYFCREIPGEYTVVYRGLQGKVISMAGHTRMEGYADLSDITFSYEGSTYAN